MGVHGYELISIQGPTRHVDTVVLSAAFSEATKMHENTILRYKSFLARISLMFISQ